MAMSVGTSSSSDFRSLLFFLFILSLLPSQVWSEVYNVTSSQPLAQGQTLVSPSQVFELGFFSPNGSAHKYVGLWHRSIFPRKIIWLANRDSPLAVTDFGNLWLVDGKHSSVWSTNVSVSTNGSAAVLLDNGSFVLKDDMGTDLWQSSDYPSDSLLPNMLLGFDTNTGKLNLLRSWKSENDPSTGRFSIGLSAQVPTQAFIWKNEETPHWRSGPWDKAKFVGVPEMNNQYQNGFTLDDNVKQGTRYFSYTLYDKYPAYMEISSDGIFRLMFALNGESWSVDYTAPINTCDSYGACGPFGFCKASDPPVCQYKIQNFIREWRSTSTCVLEFSLSEHRINPIGTTVSI